MRVQRSRSVLVLMTGLMAGSMAGLMTPLARAEYVTVSGQTFGTTFKVKVIREEKIEAEALDAAIQERLDQIDQRMSTYRDDSEVSRFNQADAEQWFSVSQETAELVQRSIEISQQTGGAFDITVGPAVALWNFGSRSSPGDFQVPSDASVAATLEQMGYDKLDVRLDPPALKKSVSGLHIDLSAIAKGYAVDAIAQLVDTYPNYMVEIGGEVRTKGSRELGQGWRIGLEAPTRNERHVDSVVTIVDQAMATSGDYRNYHVHDGVSYSHTIDPTTARPVRHALASVTVLADDCATADAWATALLVMGPHRGQTFATENNIPALLVSRATAADQADDPRQLIKIATPGFPTNPTPAGPSPATMANYMQTFIVTATVFGLAILAMSVGVILAKRRLQGSCGGMAGLKDRNGKTLCDMCTKPSSECTGENYGKSDRCTSELA